MEPKDDQVPPKAKVSLKKIRLSKGVETGLNG